MRRAARLVTYGGVFAIVLGLSKVHARYVASAPYVWHTSSRFAWSLAYVALQCIAAYGVGLPELVRTRSSAFFSGLLAAVSGAVGISLIQLLLGDALLPRFVVIGSMVLLVPWYVACAALASGGRQRAEGRDQVLLVGGVDEAAVLRHDLGGDAERPAVLVGSLTVDESRTDHSRERPLVEAVVSLGATVVVLDGVAHEDESVVAQVAALHENGVRVRTLSLFYEEWLGKLPVWELERVSLMFDIGEVHRRRYTRFKRLVDIPVAALGCVALLLAIPFVLLGNLVANRGPLLYRQERVGKDSQRFQILKFRTMRPDDGVLADEWTTVDDPRITPFGRFLRASHVDELPQVVNILRGDLAVVGPRPEQPHYVAELREKLPFYDLRHLVHPGLTGWAQVKYGYAGDERDAIEKLQYEFFYLRHQSMMFDVRIMGRTIRSVLGGKGR